MSVVCTTAALTLTALVFVAVIVARFTDYEVPVNDSSPWLMTVFLGFSLAGVSVILSRPGVRK